MITMEGKYQTRDGRSVRVLCIDRRQKGYPVLAMIGNCDQDIEPFTKEGSRHFSQDSALDLVPIPEPPKYIPFDDGDRGKVRGRWIVNAESSTEMIVDHFEEGTANGWSWAEFLNRFKFMDNGQPCGKLA